MLHIIRHDKHTHNINFNKRIIPCHRLNFSLKSMLFDGISKVSKFLYKDIFSFKVQKNHFNFQNIAF